MESAERKNPENERVENIEHIGTKLLRAAKQFGVMHPVSELIHQMMETELSDATLRRYPGFLRLVKAKDQPGIGADALADAIYGAALEMPFQSATDSEHEAYCRLIWYALRTDDAATPEVQ